MQAIKKLRITLLAMTVLLVVFLVVSTSGGTKSDVDLKALASEMLENMTDASSMQEDGTMKLKNLYGLSANDYDQAVIYVPVSNMDAAEMVLIKCKDESQTESVESAMEQRIQEQTGKFESYGVEQMAIITKAVVDVKGPYCLYVVSRSSDVAEDMFDAALKE